MLADMKEEQPKPGRDYRILQQKGAWSVEITDSGTPPRVVSGFGSQTEAYAWILHDRRKLTQH